MDSYEKPVIIISKCLEFESCRYDGKMIGSGFVRELKELVDFIPVCPEVEIGLGVPRDPINIVEVDGELKLLQSGTNRDLTDTMTDFVDQFLARLPKVNGFILKSRSPSCGVGDCRVMPSGKTNGFFAGQVLKKFPEILVTTETEILDEEKRLDFLQSVYQTLLQT